ncbi:MAG: hypothetical protein U0929_12145 [Planctomycetaceae bacterium]
MYITCPSCRASLEPDEIDRTRRECPLCSASLAKLDLSEVEDQLADESDIIAGQSSPQSRRDSESSPDTELSSPESQIEIIERSADRLVVHLPPTTAGSGGIGCFTLMWNGFMAVFTTIMVSALWNARRIEMFLILFLSVFWLVGIILFVAWLRMRFTRHYLLLEKDRLVIQRKFLGTSNRELALTSASKATLEESYAVNDVPVYAVAVHGEGRKESFGTGLPPTDKEFLAKEINSFLGVNPDVLIPSKADEVCAFCGTSLGKKESAETLSPGQLCQACQFKSEQSPSGQIWQPLRAGGAEELPEKLEVDDSSSDLVVIRYPLLPNRTFVNVFLFFSVVASLVVGGYLTMEIVRVLRQGDWVFGTIFCVIGIAKLIGIAFINLMLTLGRIQIAISNDAIRMRWGWGPISFKKLILPETITECQIVRSLPSEANTGKSRRAAASPVGFAAIRVGDTPYPLVTFHGIEYGQKVIRLVRTYVKQVTGVDLPG